MKNLNTKILSKTVYRVIADHAPDAFKEHEIKNYFGRKIAIDASMSIYQFLIAVRQQGQMLQSESGAFIFIERITSLGVLLQATRRAT